MINKKAKENAEKLLNESENFIVIGERVNVLTETEKECINQIAIVVAHHLNGLNIQQLHSFLISVRDIEDNLLEAIRKMQGLSITNTQIREDFKNEYR